MKCVYCNLLKENSEAGLLKFTVTDGDDWWISFVCLPHLETASHEAISGDMSFSVEVVD